MRIKLLVLTSFVNQIIARAKIDETQKVREGLGGKGCSGKIRARCVIGRLDL